MKGICLQAYIPLRTLPSEKSEMCSQLLFGETFQIIEENNEWISIINDFDKYKGWCSKKSINHLSESEYNNILKSKKIIVPEPFLELKQINTNKKITISCGSVIYSLEDNRFRIVDNEYIIKKTISDVKNKTIQKKVVELAIKMINTPYLWGGRSAFGIDCSGLVQTCYRIAGINLPRDAYQQAEYGVHITKIIKVRKGDLAFFKNNENKITHVGIMIDKERIIHSSTNVHIDNIDEKGIINSANGEYSHTLAFFKRIVI